MKFQTLWIALIALLIPVSACAPTRPATPAPPQLIAPPDPELMIAPSGADLPALPPPDVRRASDYEAAYFAMIDVHVPVAVRLAMLQAWARRVLADANKGGGEKIAGEPAGAKGG